MTTQEHRDKVIKLLTKLDVTQKQVQKDVAGINSRLDIINGRVRKNEQSISRMQGIGTAVSVMFGSILTWLGWK